MFGGLGIWELLIIFGLVLLIFGAKRLPEIGGSLGKGIREFKDSVKEVEGEFREGAGGTRRGEIEGSSGGERGARGESGETTSAAGGSEERA